MEEKKWAKTEKQRESSIRQETEKDLPKTSGGAGEMARFIRALATQACKSEFRSSAPK